jgi:hypothetical protein
VVPPKGRSDWVSRCRRHICEYENWRGDAAERPRGGSRLLQLSGCIPAGADGRMTLLDDGLPRTLAEYLPALLGLVASKIL